MSTDKPKLTREVLLAAYGNTHNDSLDGDQDLRSQVSHGTKLINSTQITEETLGAVIGMVQRGLIPKTLDTVAGTMYIAGFNLGFLCAQKLYEAEKLKESLDGKA
jgi:hypothetical protein